MQQTALNPETVPWWAYLLLSIAPFAIGCMMIIALLTYYKRIHLKVTGEILNVGTQYKLAFIGGFFSGGFAQYGLQELGVFLLNIPPLTLKATIVTGVFVAIFNPMVYDLLRGYSKRKKWWAIYNFLTIKKPEEKFDGDDDDKDDQTTVTFS